MLHAFLLLAAEEAEPSRTALYIVGGALAVFAVVLAAFGLSRPGFPATAGAARGVMGLTVLIVAATMVTVILTE